MGAREDLCKCVRPPETQIVGGLFDFCLRIKPFGPLATYFVVQVRAAVLDTPTPFNSRF